MEGASCGGWLDLCACHVRGGAKSTKSLDDRNVLSALSTLRWASRARAAYTCICDRARTTAEMV